MKIIESGESIRRSYVFSDILYGNFTNWFSTYIFKELSTRINKFNAPVQLEYSDYDSTHPRVDLMIDLSNELQTPKSYQFYEAIMDSFDKFVGYESAYVQSHLRFIELMEPINLSEFIKTLKEFHSSESTNVNQNSSFNP